MKKALSFLLAMLLIVSMAPTAFATNVTPGTTTLTTTVPAATYTLNIPADTTVPYGEEVFHIGNLTVTDSTSFANGKNLAVTVEYDSFVSDSVPTTIPFSLVYDTDYDAGTISYPFTKQTGGEFIFAGQTDGTVEETASQTYRDHQINVTHIAVKVNSEDWGKALAGNYTGTITFTAEVVVEE